MLVKFGADINVRNDELHTPLSVAAERNNIAIIKALISAEAVIDARCGYAGDTALHIAASKGHLEAVQILHDSGADIDVRNYNGVTPLRCAVENNNLLVVKKLIEVGAEVNTYSGCSGDSVLHGAVYESNLEIIQTLIQFGANVNAENNCYLTPLHIAIMRNNLSAIKLLISKGADASKKIGRREETILNFATAKSDFETVQCLISLGASINLTDITGTSPLHIAAKEGKLSILELLWANSSCCINLKDKNNWTMLHWAASEGHENVCYWLLERGADIQAKDSAGEIPLHLAARQGHTPVVKLLLEWVVH